MFERVLASRRAVVMGVAAAAVGTVAAACGSSGSSGSTAGSSAGSSAAASTGTGDSGDIVSTPTAAATGSIVKGGDLVIARGRSSPSR